MIVLHIAIAIVAMALLVIIAGGMGYVGSSAGKMGLYEGLWRFYTRRGIDPQSAKNRAIIIARRWEFPAHWAILVTFIVAEVYHRVAFPICAILTVMLVVVAIWMVLADLRDAKRQAAV